MLVDEVARAIAQDLDPHGVNGQAPQALDALGHRVAQAMSAVEPNDRLAAFCSVFYGELGFWGAEGNDDPRDDLLPHVLERRRGSPVALSIVAVALARRAGMVLCPVAFPGHFLLRTEDGLFMDPVGGGHPLDPGRLHELAIETLDDASAASAAMLPANPRTVAVRLLCNLQRSFRKVADHGRAMVVFDRLHDLTRSSAHRLDRGAHALALGAVVIAINDFEAYLRAHPQAPEAARLRPLLSKLEGLVHPMN
jgi:regulator of sirC expression with transglutaminase-like and TPR domain